LDDGTEVWLNAGSRLKYPVAFLGEKRKVIFSGEAFFEVKKDSRPFIVSMETGDVTVLGTSFGIRAYPGETDYTTLVTGKVCFQSKENESVILSPGEQAVFHLAGRLEKREVNVEEYVGWKDGLFVFRNETLSEIMKILGRWYGVNVIFLDDSLKELEYTGNLERYDSINTFLQLLKRLKEVHYEIKGNTVVLYK
jgi:transmembrane sensor